MWKAYLRLDAKIISFFQESYLWLLDRTGIYVATLAFMIYASACAIQVIFLNGPLWLWLPLIALVGLSLSSKYKLQDKGKNELFNFVAMAMEEMWFRHAFNLAVYTIALTEVINSNRAYRRASAAWFCRIWLYLSA